MKLTAEELRDVIVRARKAAECNNPGAVLAIVNDAVARDEQLQNYTRFVPAVRGVGRGGSHIR